MKRRTFPAISALAASVALALASGGAAAGAGTPASSGGNLYLLQAGGGSFDGSKLVLTGVDPRVASFADRPQRTSSSLATKGFVAGWGRLFGGDPPNAALEVAGAPANRDVALVELGKPRYDAASRTLTYAVKRLRKTGDSALAPFGRRADGNAVKSFGRASLFIDDGGGEPIQLNLRFKMPAGTTAYISFENVEIAITDLGLSAEGFLPPSINEEHFGPLNLGLSEIEFDARGDPNITASVELFVTRPSSGPIVGKATISPGAKVQISAGSHEQTLTGGPFRLEYP